MHEDDIEENSEEGEADPHYKPMWARWLAVFVCVTAGVTAAASPEVWRAATVSFVEQLEQWEKVYTFLPHCGKISRPGRFVQRWYDKFLGGNYTLEDAARSGRPRLLSLKEAQRAADFVKKGRWVKVKARKGTHHRLVYFTSIQDAVDHTPELQKILEDNQISVAQLRAAMHAADPDLVRRRITFKRALSKEEKEERVKTAQELIQQYERDPSFLQNMIFIDETSIVLQGGGHEHVAVWCDKHDVDFNDVCPLPIGHKQEPTKVHIIAAVSAHPAFKASNGLVYVDFTTGTSHIHRRHNRRMDGSTRVPDYSYQVGGVAGLLQGCEHTDTMLNSHHTQRALPRLVGVLQHIHIQLPPALPLSPTVGKARCQHNSSTSLGSSPSCNQGSQHTTRVFEVCCMHAQQGTARLNGCYIEPHISVSYVCFCVLMNASPMVPAIHQNPEASHKIVEINRRPPKGRDSLMAVLNMQPPAPQQLHEPALTGPHCTACR